MGRWRFWLCHPRPARKGHWQDWEGSDVAGLMSPREVVSGVGNQPGGHVKGMSPGLCVAPVCCVSLGNPHNLSEPHFLSYGIEGDDERCLSSKIATEIR